MTRPSFLWMLFPRQSVNMMSGVISRKSFELLTFLTFLAHFVCGGCLFEKHFGYKLVEPSKISLMQQVGGVFGCEKVCLDNVDKCVAANVYFVKTNVYICEIFSALRMNFSANHLLQNPRGKFIRFTGPRKLTITSCSSSSVNHEKNSCEKVYDNEPGPGGHHDWQTARLDNSPWITLNFRSISWVTTVKIWWRCAGRAQFSELTLAFSDGSSEKISHQCSTETDWLACTDDPEEVFYIRPVLASHVNISGVPCVLNDGYAGFRELELWSP